MTSAQWICLFLVLSALYVWWLLRTQGPRG